MEILGRRSIRSSMIALGLFCIGILLGFSNPTAKQAESQVPLHFVVDEKAKEKNNHILAMEAVCRVVSIDGEISKGSGTGWVCAENETQICIMTAGHVVAIGKTYKLVFYNSGFAVAPVDAELVFCNYNSNHDATKKVYDAAMLVANKKDFAGNFIPKPLKFSEKGLDSYQDCKIFSIGCAGYSWPTAFMGTAIVDSEDLCLFTPNVIAGRSGSPVLDINCRGVVGMIIWSNDTINGGVFIKTSAILKHFEMKGKDGKNVP